MPRPSLRSCKWKPSDSAPSATAANWPNAATPRSAAGCNPSGGRVSNGHPIGAPGLGQIYELVLQLRGEAEKRQVEGARFAIADNGYGFLGCEEAAACITILGRD